MYIYGKNVIKEALKEKQKIKKIYILKDFKDKNLEMIVKKSNIFLEYITKNEIDKLVKGNHQGIIALVSDYRYSKLEDLLEKPNPFLIILDHLEDPHNLGAIIRTAEAASVDGIIIPNKRSVMVNSTVVKTSAGAIENIKIASVSNLTNTINYLKKQGFWIIGTNMNGTDFEQIDYRGKIALVIGNEGKGISNIIKKNCDFIASIPMTGKINSLNASVATGIMIYEAIKQRR